MKREVLCARVKADACACIHARLCLRFFSFLTAVSRACPRKSAVCHVRVSILNCWPVWRFLRFPGRKRLSFQRFSTVLDTICRPKWPNETPLDNRGSKISVNIFNWFSIDFRFLIDYFHLHSPTAQVGGGKFFSHRWSQRQSHRIKVGQLNSSDYIIDDWLKTIETFWKFILIFPARTRHGRWDQISEQVLEQFGRRLWTIERLSREFVASSAEDCHVRK